MARASPLPAARPTSGMPASKVTKMAEIRSLARHPATPAAPIAAATAKESRPRGSTKASSLNTRHRLAHRRSAVSEDLLSSEAASGRADGAVAAACARYVYFLPRVQPLDVVVESTRHPSWRLLGASCASVDTGQRAAGLGSLRGARAAPAAR